MCLVEPIFFVFVFDCVGWLFLATNGIGGDTGFAMVMKTISQGLYVCVMYTYRMGVSVRRCNAVVKVKTLIDYVRAVHINELVTTRLFGSAEWFLSSANKNAIGFIHKAIDSKNCFVFGL